MKIDLLLEMAAQAEPDRIAVGTRDQGWTYNQLHQAANNISQTLRAKGASALVYCGLNRPEFAVALFSASIGNCTFTPLNYRLPDLGLNQLLNRVPGALALFDPDMISRVKPHKGIEVLSVDTFIQEGLKAASIEDGLIETEQDIAVMLFTSGTTSEPKKAVLRHQHLTSYVLSTLEFMSADADESTLVSVPPYHIAGISAVITSIYTGRRIVQLTAFSPESWVDTADKEQITHAMLVPTMLARVLEVIESRGVTLPSLRAISYGGGRMPLAVIEKAMDLLPNVDFVNAYGLTETSSTIAILDPESHREARHSSDPKIRARLGSVGRPLPTLDLEIRGPDNEKVDVGAKGEIWVRGDQVSGEYEGRSVLDANGWFPTKDCGWIDEGGYLFVDGRLDDVIVRGGENISPAEIEDVIRLREGVEDVAVIGVPDNEWGEKIIAILVATKPIDEHDLKEHIKGVLKSTKVPEAFFFRGELPYNETGKLLRRNLREEYAA